MASPPITYVRRLGLFSATMAVMGGIIGGGIFRTPAVVAQRTGSASLALLAWSLGGAVALAGAFCYAELAERRPLAGGAYVYLRDAFGPRLAFLYGWTELLVIQSGGTAAVALTFASYLGALTGLPQHAEVPDRPVRVIEQVRVGRHGLGEVRQRHHWHAHLYRRQ